MTPTVLALLSVLVLWSALTIVAVGFSLIRHALEGVRRRLEPVAVIVPAIERQTAPLATLADEFASALGVRAAQHDDDMFVARGRERARQD
jgi:hypothetical protein